RGPEGSGVMHSAVVSGEMVQYFKIWHLPIGPWLPIGRNGEFGRSPFFGQLIGRASLACPTPTYWCVGAKHNGSQPFYVLWHTFNSSMSCVVGCRRDDSTNQLQKL